MNEEATVLLDRECRMVRRLARLFRIERAGGFTRRSVLTAQRVIERRGELVGELVGLDAKRQSLAPASANLDLAMNALAREIDCAEQHCLDRLTELGAELERRCGIGTATGLRDGGDGRLLGSG
ncbi:MAG TPA: hypothetical protein VNV38_00050 [Stellaceae bacterium]|jgi:hypothetical protein|nr:hypothetical protein [Stellaceae bacterium]